MTPVDRSSATHRGAAYDDVDEALAAVDAAAAVSPYDAVPLALLNSEADAQLAREANAKSVRDSYDDVRAPSAAVGVAGRSANNEPQATTKRQALASELALQD